MIGAIKVVQPTWNFRLFCKTISNSASWGFDRFRLSGPKWYTRIQVRRPDGTVLAERMFSSSGSYEHDFSFDLSENVNKDEYLVYIGGVPAGGNYFQQNYAYPSGYSATTGKNAEITYWDLNEVNIGGDTSYNNDGRLKWENQPLYEIRGLHLAKATKWYIQNCQLSGALIDELLIGLYTNQINDPNNTKIINYSGNAGIPTEASREAYDWLIANGWSITGQAPPIAYEAETVAYIDRVEADGGVVLEPDYVDAVFKRLKEKNLLSTLKHWTSYRAGMKKDASNNISKLYSLASGSDVVQTTASAQPEYSASGLLLKASRFLLNNAAGMDFGANPHTLDVKFKMLSYPNSYNYLTAAGSSNEGKQTSLNITNTSKVSQSAYSSPIVEFAYDTPLNTEKDIALVYSSGATSLFSSGVFQETKNISLNVTGGGLRIGSHMGNTSFADGIVKRVRYWSQALTAQQLQDISDL